MTTSKETHAGRWLIAIAFVLAFGTSADAAIIYKTTFDNLSRDLALSQQNGWQTSDPYDAATNRGQSDVLRVVAGYSETGNDNLALLGGLSPNRPGKFSISVGRPVNTTTELTGNAGADLLRFTVEMSVSSSQTPRPNRDAFGWVFRDYAGTRLFRMSLVPDPADSTVLNVRYYDATNAETVTPFFIGYDSIYSLAVDFAVADGTRDTVTAHVADGFGSTTTLFSNVTLPNGTANEVGEIAARWDILNPGVNGSGQPSEFGLNTLIFDDYSIVVVPEPGCLGWAVAALGLSAVRRRR